MLIYVFSTYYIVENKQVTYSWWFLFRRYEYKLKLRTPGAEVNCTLPNITTRDLMVGHVFTCHIYCFFIQALAHFTLMVKHKIAGFQFHARFTCELFLLVLFWGVELVIFALFYHMLQICVSTFLIWNTGVHPWKENAVSLSFYRYF